MSCRDPFDTPCHTLTIEGIGEFSLRKLAYSDIPLVHAWVTAPRARFWGMQGQTQEQVGAVYAAQMSAPHCQPYLASCNGQPAFLLETYAPAHDELGTHYAVEAGDRGMHFLVAPPSGPAIHGFTRAVMHAILDFLFADPATRRVVVEPDINNARIHPLNRAAGFRYVKTVPLSYKTAWFAICTRQDFLIHALPSETTA
ncbi:GNAT family N-acetyltransferase [Chitinilyticum piscinae]|uniref:Acetyltransferase n=1 Tax=Chitinilyticum piscinae TaxID=2866724 RepID=A0A8J7G288_9NEIS|nr:GNAT family N-acetyltransferase [Chitinilyticum piscinae]MBE9610640.1 acetyltransferase [Chitinilyticum piscinae]